MKFAAFDAIIQPYIENALKSRRGTMLRVKMNTTLVFDDEGTLDMPSLNAGDVVLVVSDEKPRYCTTLTNYVKVLTHDGRIKWIDRRRTDEV